MTSGPQKLDCCRKESSHKIDNCNSGIILHTFIYECSAACHVHFSVGSLHEYRAQLYYDRGGWLKIHVEYSFMYVPGHYVNYHHQACTYGIRQPL